MIVIVSDLRLGDGSLNGSPPAAAFPHFAERLAELAAAASLRADGRFRPLEAIDLVLLGDVLDLIGSDDWLAVDARPWHDPHAPEVFQQVARITQRILDRNAAALGVLRELASGTANGAPVHIHYMVGDRDWPLHLPGPQYDRLRALVVEQLGLANPADMPFPHDPAESGPLMDGLRRHRVVARHGDIFDPIHFEEDRNASSLGDALAIELFARFQSEFRNRLADRSPAALLVEIAKLGNARPLLLAADWIEQLLDRMCHSPALCREVKLLWDQCVDRFLQLNFVRSRELWNPVDVVDGLADVLQFRRRTWAGRNDAAAAWLDAFMGAGDSSHGRYALGEQDIRAGRAQRVVYGHGRQLDSRPFETSAAADQVYCHTTAWQPEPPRVQERSSGDAMSFLAFYQADERSGCQYEFSSSNPTSGQWPLRTAA